jgi:predicted nucleic acid-binding protein
MRPHFYIETSVPNSYFETRSSDVSKVWRSVTRAWWQAMSERAQFVTSRYVLAELDLAPARKAVQALALLDGVPVLADSPQVTEVAAFYIRNKVMPKEAGGDAYHAACCAVYSIPFLVTWNCRHLANPLKQTHLNVINRRLGLTTPMIATPAALSPENFDAQDQDAR